MMIGAQREATGDPDVLILDTNVLIDMADFYFGKTRDEASAQISALS
jgi:hypothetical protein